MNGIFQRAALLLGENALQQAARTRVILFGVGGVGSWCAEALIRSGIGHLTLVDGDKVAESNLNRQLMATHSSLGRYKAEVLRERLLDINPQADIQVRTEMYGEASAASFPLESYDYILDCIDSRHDKILLIRSACSSPGTFFSSMGAALKADPTRVRVCDFWEVEGDPLARTLRKTIRREGHVPEKSFRCVCSDELLENKALPSEQEGRVNGSLVQVTAVFGLTLASLVIRDIMQKTEQA